jgi:hypothetical protein
MRRGVPYALAVLAVLIAAPSAAAAFEAQLKVNRSVLDVGKSARIELRVFSIAGGEKTLADKPVSRLRVEVVSPTHRVTRVRLQHVSRGIWRGSYRFLSAGRWKVRVANWPNGRGPELTVQVRPVEPTEPTPAPVGFGALGQAGCNPASPRNQAGDTLARAEVFGSTFGGRFWGLFAFMPVADAWASDDSAVVQNLVGKETKIVFKLTGGLSEFYAVAPSGARTAPVWGPEFHTSSSWARAGNEWGAGFVFGATGCWRIHADGTTDSNAPVAGDIWLRVVS